MAAHVLHPLDWHLGRLVGGTVRSGFGATLTHVRYKGSSSWNEVRFVESRVGVDNLAAAWKAHPTFIGLVKDF